jgi:hypothetical protein
LLGSQDCGFHMAANEANVATQLDAGQGAVAAPLTDGRDRYADELGDFASGHQLRACEALRCGEVVEGELDAHESRPSSPLSADPASVARDRVTVSWRVRVVEVMTGRVEVVGPAAGAAPRARDRGQAAGWGSRRG